MVGLKERLVRVHDKFWEWVLEWPDPIFTTVFCLAVGTLLCLWTLALLYFFWHFIWPLIWQALQWGKLSFRELLLSAI
jgi:RsiW-degrading membrane proteinase PrsW (M82 family)